VVSVPATLIAHPDALTKYRLYPVLFVIPVLVLLALIGIGYFARIQDDRKSFFCSCSYLAFMLAGAAVALYPRPLPSSNDPGRDITIAKALARPHTVRVGLFACWAFGMRLALIYFVIVYPMFRGKVTLESGGYGH
jgi:cytochrome bd ubiquinol oxidase subunit II